MKSSSDVAEYIVTVAEPIKIGPRRIPDTVHRYFSVYARSAHEASRAVRNSKCRGVYRIVNCEKAVTNGQ